jgi:hypothetical protein
MQGDSGSEPFRKIVKSDLIGFAQGIALGSPHDTHDGHSHQAKLLPESDDLVAA